MRRGDVIDEICSRFFSLEMLTGLSIFAILSITVLPQATRVTDVALAKQATVLSQSIAQRIEQSASLQALSANGRTKPSLTLASLNQWIMLSHGETFQDLTAEKMTCTSQGTGDAVLHTQKIEHLLGLRIWQQTYVLLALPGALQEDESIQGFKALNLGNAQSHAFIGAFECAAV